MLQGKTVQRAWAPVGDIRPLATDLLAGQSVSSVSGSGDEVLVRFAPTGVVLSVDLGSTGAWRLVPAGTSWRRLPGTVCFALEVEGWTAVCSDAVRCRLLARSQAPPSRQGA